MSKPLTTFKGLQYPDIPLPEPGTLVPVGPGVHWLRSPLNGDLNHINLWLIEHEDGFVLVDTGMATDIARSEWETLESTILRNRPLKQIVITHLHPDHVGLAAWLQKRHRVSVWMSAPTEHQVRTMLTVSSSAADEITARYLASHGLNEPVEHKGRGLNQQYRDVVSGVPDVDHFPVDGEVTVWGGTEWRWLASGGHATGHMCLHTPAKHLLISGDQILPTISPNISLIEAELDANPLATYLESLARLGQLDADTLVLPSHGRPFIGLRPRAELLGKHHREQLDKLAASFDQPRTAFETLPVMFGRVLRGFNRYLAMGEAVAHLEYLVRDGRLERLTDESGVVRFIRTSRSPS